MVVATKARLRIADEAHQRRVAEAFDLPMTDTQWSPSSGRET
jgi:hypothetical protein